jgi:hypothetical protein
VDGGTTATYLYDAGGRRVDKKIGSVARDYVYNSVSGQVVADVGAAGLDVGIFTSEIPWLRSMKTAPPTSFIGTTSAPRASSRP